MFSMLRRMPLDPSMYTYRTYVVSAGDNFSAAKAVEFEGSLLNRNHKAKEQGKKNNQPRDASTSDLGAVDHYTIVTVPRARRVHQSYVTAPFSTLHCFWACLRVLRGLHPDQNPLPRFIHSPYPDIILTNGPATAVCVILAAKTLRLVHYLLSIFPFGTPAGRKAEPRLTWDGQAPLDFQLRTIFVESWARVTTLSLSGKLLLPFVDRLLVQWPALEGKVAWKGMRKTEYVGALVA
ncbi:hypothetical protein PHISCL_03960 [Aspergillus sclerotialis]|uniref:UDP-N-acetylglucosamine transferase subunit ALG14 n=1 Tax=Aspergillus sclerotialis TaxID=2070753 RepID=A0A3A2ZWP3_9EURO|nr:hypothetical protein PHISCL_03960 [Aspergillus sclerotialis]